MIRGLNFESYLLIAFILVVEYWRQDLQGGIDLTYNNTFTSLKIKIKIIHPVYGGNICNADENTDAACNAA